jgi:FSR family fosmidomycin resistance protein-like MFS transporter
MWVASAIAGVLAGNAADRWGRRQVVFVVMILAAAPLYFLPITDVTTSAFILALLVGGLTGAPHSITVVIAQAMLPGKQATASGLILGLIFGMGALATFAIGGLADLWTLEQAMQVGAGMSLLAGVSALALPKTRAPEPLPEVELVEA